MNGDTRDVVPPALHLSCVHPAAHLETELTSGITDRIGTLDGASRSVKRREETVAGRVDLGTPVPSELSPGRDVVSVEELRQRSSPIPLVCSVDATMSVNNRVARCRSVP